MRDLSILVDLAYVVRQLCEMIRATTVATAVVGSFVYVALMQTPIHDKRTAPTNRTDAYTPPPTTCSQLPNRTHAYTTVQDLLTAPANRFQDTVWLPERYAVRLARPRCQLIALT